MNHWPFVIGAYIVAVAGIAGLTVWSWVAMRRAEKEAEKLGRGREA
ncbi:heme exporter protein CcmD [Sphingosinicella terrae]|jgi:hypothetical protein|nr:heme exporter protein CcmD [Sphingosinicella terrae]